MDTIIAEELLTFKEIEQKIFKALCEIATIITAYILRIYDVRLKQSRDRTLYRDKGLRKTSIKTIFGEVVYKRTVYETRDEDGIRHYVYLLDEAIGLSNKKGQFSENYVEKLVSGITTKSYRECAKEVSETTGQPISAMGVWGIVKSLGEKLAEEEKELVHQHKRGKLEGKKDVPVIFEESDGVNIKMQGKDRKGTRNGQAEMKVAIAYDGWRETGKNRYELSGKVVVAGISQSAEFHKIREAKIAKEYKVEEARYRFLNGDGARWIKKVPDKDTLFQLDPYHKYQAIREKIPYEKARKDIVDILQQGEIEELFRYLDIYSNSLDDEEEIKKADELIRYLRNNKDGLIPYRKRVAKVPDSPNGLIYRNMGAMEGNIWSIIARRMKGNHTTWSKRGANNLAKILAKKSEGRLDEVIPAIEKAAFEAEDANDILDEMLSAAKAPLYDGKGYEYPVQGSVVAINEALRGDPRKLFWMAGYITE